MASEQPSGLLRRAIEANLEYYTALGRLSVEYLQTLSALVTETRVPILRGVSLTRTGNMPADETSRQNRPAPGTAASVAALVLESAHGGTATGLFMVQNGLAEKVSAPVLASAFRSETGREIGPELEFDPEIVTLAPGEQMLVRVSATIDESFEPDVSYRGELSVPGIAGTPIPLVLRGRPSNSG
jgi:hypothetical protein